MFKLETERLILRDYQSDDWERVHIYGSNPDFSKYEIWGPNSIEDTKAFVNSMVIQSQETDRFKFDLAICLRENNLLIGGCGIRRKSQQSSMADLGWAINPDFQNKGYATEAAKRLIEFGFSQLNAKVIYATCDSRNTPSYKVMKKLGMERVGLLKGDKIIKGHLRDTFQYEIIK